MRIVAGVATDTGQVREGNEDSYLLEAPLFAVADGMGGARGGEVASQLALETVEARYRAGDALEDAALAANDAVFARSVADRSVAGMGTTFTAAVVEPESLHLTHVGDSRAYLLRAGDLRQLTEDHTLVRRMVAAGEITEIEADVHPHRNVLLRSLGTEPTVDLDVFDVGLLEGDRLLLCSDGLTTMITADQIKAIAESAPAPQDAADRMVRAANRAGGLDNITVLVLDVLTDESGAPEQAGTAVATGVPEARPRRSSTGTTATPGPAAAWRRPVVIGIVAALVALAGFTAFRAWLDQRWYVGVAHQHVAIYRGIPVTVLGFHLSRVDLETTIPAVDVTDLPFYEDLESGLNVETREEAIARIEQIERDLREARKAQGTGVIPGGSA